MSGIQFVQVNQEYRSSMEEKKQVQQKSILWGWGTFKGSALALKCPSRKIRVQRSRYYHKSNLFSSWNTMDLRDDALWLAFLLPSHYFYIYSAMMRLFHNIFYLLFIPTRSHNILAHIISIQSTNRCVRTLLAMLGTKKKQKSVSSQH